MKTVILIGNGKSLLKRNLGDRIDCFDEVYRFNCYKLKGFEKHIGSKTTYWVVNQSKKDTIKRMKNTHPRSRTFDRFLFSPIHEQTHLTIETCVQYQYAKKFNKPIEMISRETFFSVENITPMLITTGSLTIKHLLDKGDAIIYITGFDILIESEMLHYFSDKSYGRNVAHSVQSEREYLQDLLIQKKIHLL